MAEYDAIAREYRESKRLPFREHVERYTLFELLGDVRGATVLDLACGDGFYTRLLKEAGARDVTGGRRLRRHDRARRGARAATSLGCRYVHADVAEFEPGEPVDLVVAAYLLNYARTPEQLSASAGSAMRRSSPAGGSSA